MTEATSSATLGFQLEHSADIQLTGMSDDDDCESIPVAPYRRRSLLEGRPGIDDDEEAISKSGAFVVSSRKRISAEHLITAEPTTIWGKPNRDLSLPPQAMVSPLIARLNPFMPLWGPARSMSIVDTSQEAETKTGEAVSKQGDAHHILVEMGDLLRRFQQRQELESTEQEVPLEVLLCGLEHFRDLGIVA